MDEIKIGAVGLIDHFPQLKYVAVIAFPCSKSGYLYGRHVRKSTLFNEELDYGWGLRSFSDDDFRYKPSHFSKTSKVFDTPEEAIAFARAEVLRVFGDDPNL